MNQAGNKRRMTSRVVGLLGGSFDPAHAGHVEITRAALRRFALDQLWWLVSPGNPLKPHGPAPMQDRIAAARQLITDPRVKVSSVEADLGTRYTAETLAALAARYPKTRFIWLMGADNLMQFDQWQNWHSIITTTPLGILARPGSRLAPLKARAAQIYRWARLPAAQSHQLGRYQAPCWCYVNMPMVDLSSTALRTQAWPSGC